MIMEAEIKDVNVPKRAGQHLEMGDTGSGFSSDPAEALLSPCILDS